MTVQAVLSCALCLCLLASCARHRKPPEPPPPPPKAQSETLDIQQLSQELRALIEQRIQEQRTGAARAPGAPTTKAELQRIARALLEETRKRLQSQLRSMIERRLGPMQGLQMDEIWLEALDERGRLIDIPVAVQTRPLRFLAAPDNASTTRSILATDDVALALYDDLPSEVAPDDAVFFRRMYTGEAAAAIATEAKLLVTLKGGEWSEPQPGGRAANAIAIRGLDLDRGLLPNGNQHYDDTMYLVIEEDGGDTEVYEYRMTTESSSDREGVGRLNAKQVTYVRGLHRGKDPAYRLKGNEAEGTRLGREGTYKIMGANIHSAYTRRRIDSETPLSPTVSLGCQVIAADKDSFEEMLVNLLDGLGVTEFPYTIIAGDELSVLDGALREQARPSVLVRRVLRPEAGPYAQSQ
ncbi:MAG: hypothetical protein JXR94_19995 [Candidatus Hydrogenedentes bacterium]|nr:hypothetical protein [Candidatus Hydrogenedentota bacterium]